MTQIWILAFSRFTYLHVDKSSAKHDPETARDHTRLVRTFGRGDPSFPHFTACGEKLAGSLISGPQREPIMWQAVKSIWTQSETDLWARITAHSFESEGHVLTFTGRLARDHDWTLGLARHAVEEYRRFCFLAIVSDGEVTPSEEVDEVWHLHLTFSRDYWQQWCPNVLRRPLHHQPTAGGQTETRRFAEQYARTLALYETYFGPPDLLYWPGTAQRFAARRRFRTIDQSRMLVIPAPAVLIRGVRRVSRAIGLAGVLSGISAGPASAASWNVLDWTGERFLIFYVLAAAFALTLAFVLAAASRSRGAPETPRAFGQLDAIELAFLSGGQVRAADVLTLQLIESGHLALENGEILVPISYDRADSPPSFAAFMPAQGQSLTRRSLLGLTAPWVESVWDKLARAGLAIRRSEMSQIRGLLQWCLAPIIAIGCVKIMVGLSRDKPVGFLCILVLLTVVLAVWLPSRQPIATAAGETMLSAYYAQHARAVRAPLQHEAILAFALMGAMALDGTAWAAYADLIRQHANNGGGGCGGGDGGGGSGCGGCGGH